MQESHKSKYGNGIFIPWGYIGEDEHWWQSHGPAYLNSLGFKTAAMALTDNSVSIDDKTLQSEKRLAIILGSEGYGLSQKTIDGCDYTVKIPMYHGVDSLNVGAAAAVAFRELRVRENNKRAELQSSSSALFLLLHYEY